uniref:Uncharacterized protein n=1 Tax=viral metagenome TaxID=1070528 RepID=A0A6C0CHU4_9ZZZZ
MILSALLEEEHKIPSGIHTLIIYSWKALANFCHRYEVRKIIYSNADLKAEYEYECCKRLARDILATLSKFGSELSSDQSSVKLDVSGVAKVLELFSEGGNRNEFRLREIQFSWSGRRGLEKISVKRNSDMHFGGDPIFMLERKSESFRKVSRSNYSSSSIGEAKRSRRLSKCFDFRGEHSLDKIIATSQNS